MDIRYFISNFSKHFDLKKNPLPWELTRDLKTIITELIPNLGADFNIIDGIAIHKSTVVEKGATIKKPFIAMENCHIGANTYFREGVFLDKNVKIGASSEIKNSIICSGTAIAHLNYIGNSIIGENVNFEAGSIAANHFNERENKRIWVKYKDQLIDTGVEKFGAMVGDNSRIGANGVLSPGTILLKKSVVKRLELIDQLADN